MADLTLYSVKGSQLTTAEIDANFNALNADKFERSTILGTVSQAAGVPTGAIIERGSNANGEYVRYADGTQICWKFATVNASIPAGQGFILSANTFAAVFVGTPSFSGYGQFFSAADATGNAIYGLGYGYADGTLSVLNTGQRPLDQWPAFTLGTYAAASYRYQVLAIGRWF